MTALFAAITLAVVMLMLCALYSTHIVEAMRSTRKRNIYGKPLKKCRRHNHSRRNRGSWDDEGYCSELGGGVHQICFAVNGTTKHFSEATHQGDWSLGRVDRNHCMCLGAWALFKARQNLGEVPPTSDELVCDAIPDTALSPVYVSRWNTWNGHQKDKQVMDGVKALYEQCRNRSDRAGNAYLDGKYGHLLAYISAPQQDSS